MHLLAQIERNLFRSLTLDDVPILAKNGLVEFPERLVSLRRGGVIACTPQVDLAELGRYRGDGQRGDGDVA